jgi:hypothetical protein
MSSIEEQDMPGRNSPAGGRLPDNPPDDPRHQGQRDPEKREPEKEAPPEPGQPGTEEFPPREIPNPQDNPPTKA